MVKGEPAEAGSILDLEANDAYLLISSNKAIEAKEEVVVEPALVEPEVTAVLEPVLEPAEATLQAEEELAPEEVVEVVETAPIRRTRKPRSFKE